ncbi:DUF6036 family nucleotidyltransferase [Bhargavaea ullalensis]|uniref:DUF6036 domain-containing protein n=1 Tax=Bhargavaea ullalensis TaxID=1265685 RepID=A0ABV2GCU6_9BACL
MEKDHDQYTKSEEIVDHLFLLDFLCIQAGVKAELVVLGGSGILLQLELNNHTDFRPTQDIDVNVTSATNFDAIYEQLKKANIHPVGGVMEVPPLEDFQEEDSRQELDVPFSNIRVFVPSIELLACCKIFSKREKDLEDLESSSLLEMCNQELLGDMIAEYEENLLNKHDPNLNLHQLERILDEKGIV